MKREDLVRDIVQASVEFHERRLWKRFTNLDCFAIRVPGAEDPLLASVMGAGGEYYGLMLHRGPRAAASLAALAGGGGPGDDAAEELDMLGLSFEAFGNMSPKAQAFFRQAGIHPRHDEKLPDFLVKPPRRQARLPNDAELSLLLMVLKGVVAADRRKLLKPTRIEDAEGICSLELHGDPASPAVSATHERLLLRSAPAQPIAASVSAPDLRGLALLDATWLVGAPVYPGRVKDDERRVRLLLVVDDASEMILRASAFFSEQTREMADALVETFRSHPPDGGRGVAKSIVFSSRPLYDVMAPGLRELGVKCLHQPVIAKLEAIAANLHEFIDRDEPARDDHPEKGESGEGKLPADDDLAGWKEADRRLMQRFVQFVRDSNFLGSAQAVRRYFHDDDIRSFLRKHEQRGVVAAYAAWGVLDYRPSTSSATQAENMLARGLPQAQAMLLRARVEAHPTIYRVAGRHPSSGTVDLEDVLLGAAVTVHDQLLSENVEDSWFLVLRVFPAGRFHFLDLAGPPLGVGMGTDAVEFLRECGLEFTRDGLKRGAHKFGWLWGWVDAWEASWRPPRLCNTDGDALLLHTASFAVADPLATRKALLNRNDIDYDEEEDEFTWFRDAGEAAETLGGRVSLGRLEFVGDELVLTVNSARRFETARQWLTDLPGVAFRDVTTRRLEPGADESPLDERISEPQPVEITSEMAAAMQELVDRQTMKWIDTPLPTLDGKTPREACRTPSGREQVTILIRTMPDPMGPASIRLPRQAMLRELGLATEPPPRDDGAG